MKIYFILISGINFIALLRGEGKIRITLKNIYNTKFCIRNKVNKSLTLLYVIHDFWIIRLYTKFIPSIL